MADDVNLQFNGKQNELLQKLIKQFVKEVSAVVDSE